MCVCDFESTFIETKKVLGEARESLGGAALALKKCYGKEMSQD